MSVIVPAIIPTSAEYLRVSLDSLLAVPEVHIDVVDGRFVPYSSWPYEPAGDVSVLTDILAPLCVEVDLMVEEPLTAARLWEGCDVEMLVFHQETISLDNFASFITTTDISVGICANNSTAYADLAPYLAVADYVQVMGIAEVGRQGQPFDESIFARIADIRRDFPNLPISIDGSMGKDTLPRFAELGISRFIVGSAIIKTDNPLEAYLALQVIVS